MMIKKRMRYIESHIELMKLILDVSRSAMGAWRLGRRNRISRPFSEKIMLAVTGVNECAYCSYLHSQTALEGGVSTAEIQRLLEGELGDFPEEEAVGLMYAQHWADTKGKVSDEVRKNVVACYGEKRTGYIELFIKMVYMGNVCSNTVYAFENGMMPKSSKARLFLIYLVSKPVAVYINRSAARLERSAA
ncbi:MAG: carboxymuconolactone decarboxylase family protein [Dehalococcoidia bacterium]